MSEVQKLADSWHHCLLLRALGLSQASERWEEGEGASQERYMSHSSFKVQKIKHALNKDD